MQRRSLNIIFDTALFSVSELLLRLNLSIMPLVQEIHEAIFLGIKGVESLPSKLTTRASVDIPGIFLIVQRFEAPLVGAGIMQKDILYYLCI